ncbi:MAG: STAS domain-containing protein, partial [Fibrobacter sp.]|nr:STAS domain-containing protein [Fibrobacter sp.]
MEDGEVFDSSLLKDCVHSLIANGKRNFAIDLTNLDYLYSDTINVLMALNKRALEVSGRLSLLAPQEEVLQILKRAGIHNILRIFDTEDDLLKTSEDIVLQTTSYNMGDIRNAQDNGAHQSEFDQLRNEIGSVFDSSAEVDGDQQKFTQQGYGTNPSIDQEFDEAFQHFESEDGFEDQGDQFGGQDQYVDPYAQTPPPQYKNVPSGGQQFGNRQFVPTPPPPMSPKMPRQPAGMPHQAPSADIGSRQETQRFAQAPAAPQKPSSKSSDRAPKDYMDDSFNPTSNFKTTKMDTFDDDEFGADEHKKSKMPVLIAAIVVVALCGVGAFFALSGSKKPAPKPVAKVTEQPKPAVPQIPADTADTVKEAQAEPKEPVEPEEPKTVVKKVASSRPAPKPAASKPAPRKSTPRPAPAPKPAVEANEVVFTSVPS